MTRFLAMLVSTSLGFTVMAGGLDGDQRLIDEAPADGATPAPPARAESSATLDAAEREARVAANTALARLELVLARKEIRNGDLKSAAKKAQHVLVLLRQLPPEVDVTEYSLQAEGILARAQQAGINVEMLKRDAAETAPLREDDARLDRDVEAAARVARQYDGAPRRDIDDSGDLRVLRERTLRRQASDRFGYRPGREIVDREAIVALDRQRTIYQDAMREAYKADESRLLVDADETRVVPDGVISYPNDWPQRVARRAQYKDGVVARSPSWFDDEGREWYIAIYDIHDLIYVPPDFGTDRPWYGSGYARQMMADREALRDHSMIFRGGARELAEGIPLLRYFGGVNPLVMRGPKYSMEKQREIVELIQAFTGARVDDTLTLPPAP